MTDIQFKWEVEERPNCHSKRGKEWALNMIVPYEGTWTIATWESVKKPTNKEIERFLQAYSQGVEAGVLMARKALYTMTVSRPRVEDET